MQDGRLPVHYAAAKPEAQPLYEALLAAAATGETPLHIGRIFLNGWQMSSLLVSLICCSLPPYARICFLLLVQFYYSYRNSLRWPLTVIAKTEDRSTWVCSYLTDKRINPRFESLTLLAEDSNDQGLRKSIFLSILLACAWPSPIFPVHRPYCKGTVVHKRRHLSRCFPSKATCYVTDRVCYSGGPDETKLQYNF
jgi:hypothetical protein